jgi:hypothetical protein
MVNGPQGFAMTKAGMLKIPKEDTVRLFFWVSENAHFLPARYTMELIHISNLLISTEKLKNENN